MNLSQIIIKWGLERLGRYYSNYRAIVVGNQDPEGLGRIQVIVPRIHYRNKTPLWAYPKNQYIGKDIGLHILPKKEEMVWVEFEGGNPAFPIWSFSGSNKKQPYPKEFLNKENVYGFKTNKFILQIDDDSDTLEIIGHGNEKISINSDGISLTKGNSKIEPMLLGDISQEVIQEDISNLITLCDNLSQFCDAVNIAATNTPTIAPLGPIAINLKLAIETLKMGINTNKTKSNNIKSKTSKLN